MSLDIQTKDDKVNNNNEAVVDGRLNYKVPTVTVFASATVLLGTSGVGTDASLQLS